MLVPALYTLQELHGVIQAVIGWEGVHLYEFQIRAARYGSPDLCLMILKFPDRDSVYGFMTRITPFWFHIFYKRYMCGFVHAGKPGFEPLPTVHEEIIARKSFTQFIGRGNLKVKAQRGFGTLPAFQRFGTKVVATMSLGHLTADCYNLPYVLQTEPLRRTSR